MSKSRRPARPRTTAATTADQRTRARTDPRPAPPAADPDAPAAPSRRAEIAQQGRLWLLALICATAGAITVGRTDSVYTGAAVFLAAVAVLGPVLYIYEKKHARR